MRFLIPGASLFAGALAATILPSDHVQAEGWGRLTGRFVYDGKAPAPQAIAVNAPFARNLNLVDESLLVGPRGGLKNVVVYLYLRRGEQPPPVHPELAKAAQQPVTFGANGGRFDPHIALVQAHQMLILTNADPVTYGVKVDVLNQPINPLLPPNARLPLQFKTGERLPARVSCNIHPWMAGWLVIKDHPYMAVSDDNGKFAIEKIPAGDWTFQFWHEKPGYLDQVTVDGKPVQWNRGRVELSIQDNETLDLGNVKVAPAMFE